DADGFHDILDRVFAGLAIDVVPEQDAAPAARGPREDSAHEVATHVVTELAHRHRGVLESVVVAMDEKDDLLAARVDQSSLDLRLELPLRIFMRVDDRLLPRKTFRNNREFVRDARKAPELPGRTERQLEPSASHGGALLDEK